jgi:hypothetical protein
MMRLASSGVRSSTGIWFTFWDFDMDTTRRLHPSAVSATEAATTYLNNERWACGAPLGIKV